MAPQKSYLIKNAAPIGFNISNTASLPAGESDTLDIGVNKAGKIDYLGPSEEIFREKDQPASDYDRVLDLAGTYLSPGWIDLHTHIYKGVSDIGVDPAAAGPQKGVVSTVDAGSAGEASFSGFRDYVVRPADFPIYAFLNIGSTGIIAANRVSELQNEDCIDLERTVKCIAENKDIIRGVKIRASRRIIGNIGLKAFRLAQKAAHKTGLPLIVHLGEPPLYLADIVENLTSGDLMTHCFNGKRGINLREDIEILRLFKKAQKKGILLDVGHGGASYSHPVACRAVAENLYPDTISTDLHRQSIQGPVRDLATTASKIREAGLSLSEVIARITAAPAQFLGLEGWTDLKIGSRAALTAFEVKKGRFPVRDAAARTEVTAAARKETNRINLSRLIIPRYSFWKNRITEAAFDPGAL